MQQFTADPMGVAVPPQALPILRRMPFARRCLAGGLLLLFGVNAVLAQTSQTLETQFRSVTVPQNTVPTVAQDRAGFIWVATAKGLTRYDGYRLRPIELPGQTVVQRNLGWVRALAPARDGRMWIGTEFMGLAIYDPEQDRVTPLGSAFNGGEHQAPVRALAEDAEGQVWIGTLGQGLQAYDPAQRQFKTWPLRWQGEAEARVLALAHARDGSLWIGHWRGLTRLFEGNWSHYTAEGPESPVLALAVARDGRVWLGTQDGRLGVTDSGRVRWMQSLQAPVQAIAEAADGLIWVGTKTGLLWVDAQTGQVLRKLRHDPRRSTGPAGNDISAILRDQTDAMWVSGYGLGLQRHLENPGLSVRGADTTAAAPLDEIDVRALLMRRNGEVLAPTQTGRVVRLDGRPGQQLRSLGLLPRERQTIVESLAEAADGTLWMAAAGRLEQRSSEGRLLRDWPLDGGRAQQLVLRDGQVWLGMQEGLYRLASPQAPSLERVRLADGRPLLGSITAIRPDLQNGRFWIGGMQGLYREQAEGIRPVPQAPGETLGNPIVMGLLSGRDGTLWVDTPVAGLHRLRGWDAQGRARFERIGERLGMEGVFGGNLHEDAQGRIWSQLNVYDPRDDRVESFGFAEGASFGSFWFFASCTLPDGSYLFGGSRGLLRIDPVRYRPRSSQVPLVISALRVNGQPFQPERLQPRLQLPAGTRTLGVEFAGLDYADPAGLRYQYRLLGLDQEWTQADASARSPSFGPLKPGHYQLQLRASPAHTAGAGTELKLDIELLPNWWQTLWAQLGAVLLGLLVVRAWVRWRTRRLLRREAELQALVDARTAELREASLTDTLTGLRNRRYLELRLPDDLRLCLRRYESDEPGLPGPDSDLVVMVLDLDHFKRVNDEHGHAAGDAVLVQLAERLRGVFRETDSLVRWGGEEVLALVRGTSREAAAELAERVCTAVREQPFDIGEAQAVPVTVSIGFAVFPLDPQLPRAWEWQDCLALADSALYAAKALGRDAYVGAVQADGLSPEQAPRELRSWLIEPRLQVRRSA